MSRPTMPHSVSPPPGDCVIWTGSKDRDGYGYASWGPRRSDGGNERSVPRPPPGRGTGLDAADIVVIWVLLAAFTIDVFYLLALAIRTAYRAA